MNQVRATDLLEDTRSNVSVSHNDQSLSLDQPDIPRVGVSKDNLPTDIEAEYEARHDAPDNESENLASDDGVKYCRLDIDNSVLDRKEDARGEKKMSDHSMPCSSSTECS